MSMHWTGDERYAAAPPRRHTRAEYGAAVDAIERMLAEERRVRRAAWAAYDAEEAARETAVPAPERARWDWRSVAIVGAVCALGCAGWIGAILLAFRRLTQ